MSELRWHPLLGEWVITATHRQNRTFLPTAGHCPLCPSQPGGYETEIAAPTYDIVAFENRFPSLQHPAPEPSVSGSILHPVRPANGVCEVISYTPEHDGTFAAQAPERIRHLVRVWRHRYEGLGSLPFVDYVLIFENKGTVIGVTLQHPHGQIYAYPFLPPLPARELENGDEYRRRTGHCLVCDVVVDEVEDGRRIVAFNDCFVAAIPFFARWPYEVHVWSRQHLGSLSDFTVADDEALADILLQVTRGYDALPGFEPPFPYMMAIHQRPTDGKPHQDAHFHIEFYPPYRRPGRLKYLAAVESAGGNWVNDTLPEERAAELAQAITGQKEKLL